ncbi:NAD(P)-binding domain-containing protein [Actinosynnema sp. NPDC020468]|uniref:NADPH-dependent F420 reductase n=1 Tax=Actinosynnema sp. NPDC020468 TaxID=3154488 RepID=UPI0033F94672
MRIGVLGSGGMAEALGGKWVAAGHEVVIGGRGRQRDLADRIGARAGTVDEARAFGDVLLTAVPADVALEVLGDATGKVVVDCTNSVAPGFVLDEPEQARRLARSGGDVVKAFNLCHVDVWRTPEPVFQGRPLGVPLCGDSPEALHVVARLVRDAGCAPVLAGGLDRAALLEAAAAFVIKLWVEDQDVRSLFPG